MLDKMRLRLDELVILRSTISPKDNVEEVKTRQSKTNLVRYEPILRADVV